CARCHEHKLEPISQRDYYQLQAVLMASYDPDRWLASGERALPLATDAQQSSIDAHNKAIAERVAALQAESSRLLAEHRDKLFQEKLPQIPDPVKEPLKAALLLAADKRNDEQKKLVAEHAAGVAIDDNALFVRFAELKKEIEK